MILEDLLEARWDRDMGRTIRLHDEKHWALQSLLPGYATGRLSPEERARVEAHLGDCAECREELRLEEILAQSLKDLPLQHRPRRCRAARIAAWAGWAVAASALATVGFVVLPHVPARPRLLGASPSAAPGDLVVVFRPQATESDIRSALQGAGARIVDGPTASDAYVLAAPVARRTAALAKLRASHGVIMAEPVDPAPAS